MVALTEIKRLINNGQNKSHIDKQSSIKPFNEAKSIAKKKNLEKEIILIDSYIQYYIKNDYDTTKSFLEKYHKIKDIQLISYYYFLYGNIYYNEGDYDRAIESYQKALDTPGYDTPGMALNNLGLAYSKKGDYDRAIESYQKALDTPGYDTAEMALNNLGLVYLQKRRS